MRVEIQEVLIKKQAEYSEESEKNKQLKSGARKPIRR
jgi:hypothetical protein